MHEIIFWISGEGAMNGPCSALCGRWLEVIQKWCSPGRRIPGQFKVLMSSVAIFVSNLCTFRWDFCAVAWHCMPVSAAHHPARKMCVWTAQLMVWRMLWHHLIFLNWLWWQLASREIHLWWNLVLDQNVCRHTYEGCMCLKTKRSESVVRY